MGLRYYTSKIEKFRDLESCVSYGFRGEALNSVCALGEVVVVTKTEKDEVAIEYSLGPDGSVLTEKPSSFGTGTTVVVGNIFHGLPVRRQVAFVQFELDLNLNLEKIDFILCSIS